jgi:fucose permease
MSGIHAVTVVTITGAFVFGMVLALVGSLKLSLAKRLGIGEARVGGLLSALHLAFIPMMLLSGLLIDRFDVRLVLVLGCVLTAGAFYALTVRETYSAALLAMLLAGVGAACVSTACVVLMPRAFFEGDERKVSAALNLGTVFIALGSLVTPTLADVLLRTVDFRRTLGLLALLCLVPAVVVATQLNAGGQFQLAPHAYDPGAVLGDPRLWLAGLVFFVYGPLEFAVGTWATTYLIDLGYKERRAAWLLSGFWLTFLAARVLMAFLEERGTLRSGSEYWLIPILGLLAAVILGNLAGAATYGRGALGLLVLGAVLGPIFPTLIGILFDVFKHDRPRGTAYGAMFAIGSMGSLILAPLIGSYARGKTVQQALRIPMVLALVMAGVAIVLGLMK